MTRYSSDKIRKEGMDYYGFGPQAMKKIKVCKHCGTVNTSTRHFCTACNAPLSTKTLYDEYLEKHLHCPYCLTVLDDPVNYCPQCGKKLSGKTPSDQNELK